MDRIRFSSIVILFIFTTKLRNSTSFIQKVYLLSLVYKVYSLSLYRTILIYSLYYFSFFKQIRISSRQTIQIESTRYPKALQIYTQKVTRVLVRPKGITIYLNKLYLVLKIVFYSSPFLILNQQYISQRSSLVNTLAYSNQLSNLLIKSKK